MVRALGVELVEVPRFQRALERHGERLRRRVFTEGERAYAERRRRAAESLAVRFAAKSAARRALAGEEPVGWREVEVVRERGQAPTLRFHGAAARRAAALGVSRVALTLTHDSAACVAQVVLED